MDESSPITVAAARMPEKSTVVCIYVPGLELIESFAEACFRFTSQVAVGRQAIFLEIGRSQKIFKEEQIYLRLAALARRFRAQPVIRGSNDAATALSKAVYNSSNVGALPLESLRFFNSPFEYSEEAEMFTEKIVSTLRRLGLRTIEEFTMLPASAITSRFGEIGLELWVRVQEGYHEPWPLYKPRETVVETVDIEAENDFQTIGSIEPLFFFAKILVDRILARLKGRNEIVGALRLKLVMDRGLTNQERINMREVELRFPFPQSSSQIILKILKDRLEGELLRRQLQAPAAMMELMVLETAPALTPQKDFFHRKSEEKEEWRGLHLRISEQVGDGKVFMAEIEPRHLPEKAWKPVRENQQMLLPSVDLIPCAIPRRPTRLLPSPKRLFRQGKFLFDEGNRKIWMIRDWDGPERLHSEWWTDEQGKGFARDYYSVTTETGENLWIYRDRQSLCGRAQEGLVYFLHGFFD